tara:strand:+ start:2529 stop:2993 length:465 start_codon:yes stop_codon:yes gene_type:complete
MKRFIIFLFLLLFIVNCSSNKVSNTHGFTSLQAKYERIIINKTNKNDIYKILGPPSTISNFDENKWFYIQTRKENQSLLRLGIKKIEKNNVLIVSFNNKGILEEKKILNLDDMNDIKYVKEITKKEYKQNNTIYKILSSLREKANSGVRNRSKK